MQHIDKHSIFVTCPKGLNYALERELQRIGLSETKSVPAGVYGKADKKTIYSILLWSRIANRVMLPLQEMKVEKPEHVYDAAYAIDWSKHFSKENSFIVDFTGTNQLINNTEFGAFKVKDGIVDKFREQFGDRPSVDKKEPDIRVNAHLNKGTVTISIDLSGDSLHKRSYRSQTGKAPLKENLAAGILALSGWPDKFSVDAGFIDPMCGSGTFLIEAAMMAFDRAPGLSRERWGFSKWRQHDDRVWNSLVAAAQDRFKNATQNSGKRRIIGFDQDAKVVARAWENIKSAGFEDIIHVEKRLLDDFSLFEKVNDGLVMTNPPYGARLGTIKELIATYQKLGQMFFDQLLGWKAGIFTGNLDLGKSVGWRSYKQYKLFNGAIESQLILIDLQERNRHRDISGISDYLKGSSSWKISNEERAVMLKNRLAKNIKTITKWAQKKNIQCYRLYDADMPEYAFALDVYRAIEGQLYLHVQEYQAPKSVDLKSARERLSEGLAVISDIQIAGDVVKPEHIFVKQRSIKKGLSQYEKESNEKQFIEVEEEGVRLQVNLKDYLDTGLFLDHRPIRRWIREHARDKRFLNLFCYTGVATLHAIAGGAKSSMSVDMSKTYLNWLRHNMRVNQFKTGTHLMEQANCLTWLESGLDEDRYDLIFLDPPSFSNSKRMEGVLDIQRDHVELVNLAMNKLALGGTLIFSNNLRRFKLSEQIREQFEVKDMTGQSFDEDFKRNKHIHQVWQIRHKA